MYLFQFYIFKFYNYAIYNYLNFSKNTYLEIYNCDIKKILIQNH